MTLEAINTWHQRARPEPTLVHFGTQLGCHIEEFIEMLDSLSFHATDEQRQMMGVAHSVLGLVSRDLKSGAMTVRVENRKELLDAMADQIVTAVGVGHCAQVDILEACKRVNDSNWTKYDDQGQPIFKEGGKIAKGPNYVEPDLEGLY
jgi:hypothetical protein